MSHKIFIVLCLLSMFGCSSSRHSIPHDVLGTAPEESSIHFKKINFRIEVDGQLRTHRSSLSFYSDTLIHLSITSGFNKQIAFVVFDKRGMQFFDIFSNSGFFISANEFKEEFGICNLPQTVKSYLLGYPIDSLPRIEVSNRIDCTYDSTSFETEKSTNQYYSIHINSLRSSNNILVKYLWSAKSKKPFPRSTYLTIALSKDVYEFDLEYNHKSIKNTNHTISEEDIFDLLSTYTFKND